MKKIPTTLDSKVQYTKRGFQRIWKTITKEAEKII